MKKLILTALIAASFSVAVQAAPPASGSPGTIRFEGEIVTGACGIDSDSLDQTVSLGQVPTHMFKAIGDRSTAVPFEIVLTDCDTTTSKNATVTFTGTGHEEKSTILGVTGAAQHVGIRLQGGSNEYLDLGTVSQPTLLSNGDNHLKFSAMYESTAANVTAGDADSTAQFTVNYL
ncbi:fimbrial protein [Yersinia frederiksenii]|uniref:fimbrial protein n=1 Tax=Yersinia frederiksenii TaxID=29484 RepID=UPI0005E912F4|nr:fimbrial protein [Yersinia frederiksenii]CQJ04955.1 putative mannose-resistant/Proteus-like fimbrial protein [Yersinia frederiksenii]